jgi:hypothetical protein
MLVYQEKGDVLVSHSHVFKGVILSSRNQAGWYSSIILELYLEVPDSNLLSGLSVTLTELFHGFSLASPG